MPGNIDDVDKRVKRVYLDEVLQRAQETCLKEVTPEQARSLGLAPCLERPKIISCPLDENGMGDGALQIGMINMGAPAGACAYVRSERNLFITSEGRTHARLFAVYYFEKPKEI